MGDVDGLLCQRRRRRPTKPRTSTLPSRPHLPRDDRPLGPTPSTVHAFGSHENARQAHWHLLRGVMSRALAAGDWARAAEAAAPLLRTAFGGGGGGGASASASAPGPSASSLAAAAASAAASMPFSSHGRRELERATLLLESVEALHWLPAPPSSSSSSSTAPLIRRSLRAAASAASSAAVSPSAASSTPLLLAAGKTSTEAVLALAEELVLSGDAPQSADVLSAALSVVSATAPSRSSLQQPALMRALALSRHSQWLQATGLLGAGGAGLAGSISASSSSATAALAREAVAEVERALLAVADSSNGSSSGSSDAELLFAGVQLRLALSGSALRAAELLLPPAAAAAEGGDADALALALSLSLAAGAKSSSSSKVTKRNQALLASAILSSAPRSGRALSALLSASASASEAAGGARKKGRRHAAAEVLIALHLRAFGCSLFLDACLSGPDHPSGGGLHCKKKNKEGRWRARACRAAAAALGPALAALAVAAAAAAPAQESERGAAGRAHEALKRLESLPKAVSSSSSSSSSSDDDGGSSSSSESESESGSSDGEDEEEGEEGDETDIVTATFSAQGEARSALLRLRLRPHAWASNQIAKKATSSAPRAVAAARLASAAALLSGARCPLATSTAEALSSFPLAAATGVKDEEEAFVAALTALRASIKLAEELEREEGG